MTSKEMLVEMYILSIDNIGMFEKADRLRECYNKIADDLEILEILKPYINLDVLYEEDAKKIREWLDNDK